MQRKEIRKYFIEACNALSEESVNNFSEEQDVYSHFVRNMIAFIHERIDAIIVLTHNNILWDSEIIFRPIAEASIKLIYVSLHDADGRIDKAKEFWVDLAEINKIKQSKQATQTIESLKSIKFQSLHLECLLLSDLELDKLTSKWSKKKRQQISQAWSYNEMLKKISTLSSNRTIECLNRPFAQSSHIIHADETALGIINDRKNRVKKEKDNLIKLHENRLFNDCIALYSESIRVVNKAYKIKNNSKTIVALSNFYKISNEYEKYSCL